MARTQPIPDVPGPPPDDPLPGMTLGDYRIERAVASGGMGIVYSAVHLKLRFKVAVKVLRPEFARNAEQVERFLKEAQSVASIRHRGIIHVHTFGDLPDGRQFMVMEFLEGEPLETVLRKEAPMSPALALPIIDEVLDALSAAHQVGVVHRDLKPSNVFMSRQSNGSRYAKLVDFGLAQAVPFTGNESQAFAKASVLAGTPEYISPEQARGLVATPRSDLYSLGVMVFEMLTGALPFAGNSLVEYLQAHVNQPAPRISAYMPVPEDLDDWVASLLEKKPEDRPRSAELARKSIARILADVKEASTQQVRRPTGPGLPSPDVGTVPMEDTQIRGSDPAMAKEIKAVRERASGPRPSAARTRPSRPSAPPRPAPAELPPDPDPAPTLQSTQLNPKYEVPAAAPKSQAVVLWGGFVTVLIAGALATVALVEAKLPTPVATTPRDVVTPKTPEPPTDPKPVPVAAPIDEQQLKAQLEEAERNEASLNQQKADRNFTGKLKNMGLQHGIRRANEKEVAEQVGHLFGNEVVESEDQEKKRLAALPANALAIEKIRIAKSEAECKGNWKPAWRKKIIEARASKIAALSEDLPEPQKATTEIEEAAKDLTQFVNDANNVSDCREARSSVELWVKSR